MVKRYRSDPKTGSKSKSVTSDLRPRPRMLFGEPQLLAGENAAAYDELLSRLRAAATPVDVIEEMLIDDVMSLEWEILRWRRLKLSLIRSRGLEALKTFLSKNLDYDQYSDHFAEHLTEILQENLPEDQSESFAQTLAQKCARNESDAVDKINKILAGANLDMDNIVDQAQADKAEELVQQYARGEPDAVTLISELLAGAGVSMDTLVADALVEQLDDIERIDRLTTIAESRRNTSLREIDRRRMVLGETLRRGMQEIEDGEFKVIETRSAKRKTAA
jgi:hypothetical protein